MNKQEVLQKIEETRTEFFKVATNLSVDSNIINLGYGAFAALNYASSIVKQLDEPQKPIVPKFVAEWFEDAKDDLENPIFYECVRVMEICREDRNEFQQWFANSKNKAIETLILMENGYEVEKEQLYSVIIEERYLVKVFIDKNVVILVPESEINQYVPAAYELTEAQIKSIDERYWAFAVPVEEVTER